MTRSILTYRQVLVFAPAFLLAFASGLPGAKAGDEGPAGDPIEAAVKRCIESLGSGDFAARETAQSELAALGEDALPILRRHEKAADDPEIRIRLSAAIQKIEFPLAFRGPLEPHLSNLFSEDPEAVKKASEALLRLGSFPVPWLEQAAESADNRAVRARLMDLIARVDIDPETDEAERFYRKNVMIRSPGAEEVPPGDQSGPDLFAAGLSKKAVRFLLLRHPESLAAARICLDARDFGRALDILVSLAERRPERMKGVLSLAANMMFHCTDEFRGRVERIEKLALEQQKALPREEAATIAKALASWYRKDRKERLEAFRMDFPDTAAGAASELDGLLDSAFQLSTINKLQTYPDPLDRLMRLAAVVRRIEEGGFELRPAHRGAMLDRLLEFWLKAEDLAKHPYAAEEILAVYRILFRGCFLADSSGAFGRGAVYYFESKMRALHGALGAGPEAAEKAVDAELEVIGRNPAMRNAVRFLRAGRFLKAGDAAAGNAMLEALRSDSPETLYGRKALAVLANAAYVSGRTPEAAALYSEYAGRFPFSPWAWVAALRAGHCGMLGGRWNEAIEAYRGARAAFPEHPLLVPAVHARLGWIFEELEDGEGALKEYETALSRWDDDFGNEIKTPLEGAKAPAGALLDPDGPVSREWVEARVRELKRADSDRTAIMRFEKARRRRQAGKTDEALDIWKSLSGPAIAGSLAAEARAQVSRTLIEKAAALANRAAGTPDEEKALAAMKEAAEWGDDFCRFCAGTATAFLLLRGQRSQSDAAGMLEAALEALLKARPPGEPGTAIEKEVAAARNAVFRPYDRVFFTREWTPAKRHPFHVAYPRIRVIFNDGFETSLSFRQEFTEAEKVVFLTGEEQEFISRLIDEFGACEKPGGKAPGERERIPGDTDAIVELLNRFFPVRHGHWGGWHLATYPILYEMRFTDDRRESALFEFRVGYSGGEARLKKVDGAWSLEEVKSTWIE